MKRIVRNLGGDRYRRVGGRGDGLEWMIVWLGASLIGVAALAAWAGVTLLGNDDLAPLETTVAEVARESSAVTNSFLSVAEDAGGMAIRALEDNPAHTSEELRSVLRYITVEHDAVDGVFVGYGDGSFVYATKGVATEPGGVRLKHIQDADLPSRTVTETQFDSALNPVMRTELSGDDYDPRQRLWYLGATERATGWTEPYEFSSSGEPGITFFIRHRSFETTGAVVGVDMRLQDVVAFLARRQPGPNGVAAMIAESGAMVSGVNVPDEATLADVTSIDIAEQSGPHVFQTHYDSGEPSQVSAVSTVGNKASWQLVVTATESDFEATLGGTDVGVRTVLPLATALFAFVVAVVAFAARERLRRLRRKATVDRESGALTRAEAHSRLDAALQDGWPLLVVSLELGNRYVGLEPELTSSLLAEVGRQLRDFAEPVGIVGRTGTSEFMVARPLAETDQPVALMQTLRDDLDAQMAPGRRSGAARHTVSIGWLAVRESVSFVEMSAVLRNASLAMLAAEAGPQRLVEYNEELQPPAVADERLRRDLQESIDAGAFVAYFQPEVDLVTGDVVGAEALLRLVGTGGRTTSASAFIGDLERLNLLKALTHQTLDSAVDFAARWGARPNFVIRLNLAASELNEPTVRDRLERIVQLTSNAWCVEITERTIEALDDQAIQGLHRLAEVGVQIALDDFGTGYSSMAELKRLPITTLKIDRTFVEPLEGTGRRNVSIASLVHDVAERLGLSVVAEGVETESQREALVDLGCFRGQGWLIAPAMAPNDFVVWAQEQQVLDLRR